MILQVESKSFGDTCTHIVDRLVFDNDLHSPHDLVLPYAHRTPPLCCRFYRDSHFKLLIPITYVKILFAVWRCKE